MAKIGSYKWEGREKINRELAKAAEREIEEAKSNV